MRSYPGGASWNAASRVSHTGSGIVSTGGSLVVRAVERVMDAVEGRGQGMASLPPLLPGGGSVAGDVVLEGHRAAHQLPGDAVGEVAVLGVDGEPRQLRDVREPPAPGGCLGPPVPAGRVSGSRTGRADEGGCRRVPVVVLGA